ncbi:MAG: glycosyltransferase family 39 protein [Candidatus Electrothrix aestuarii]|uniref:Glycosyltransferase family 39 protein n=1 Tax=Candidatus Electrothrix aestuarii TaxID=3062594 RepID=A0AAU8LSP7_9BACT|nr:glycosyltransferase family 39 protein [Candidatus Electrothrix aestuarii]
MKNTQSFSCSNNSVEHAKYLYLALLAVIFLVEFVLSFGWRVRGDSIFIHYLACLINEHGFVPYRDLFEINMPGTYLFHIAIGKLFGYSDYALRMVNVAWLAATLLVTWFIMKPFGRVTALAACLLFSIIYLGFGPDMSLQRDFITILPIATAILLTIRPKRNHPDNFIHLLLGVLFAFVALIKPYHAIWLPVLIVYNCIQNSNGSVKTLLKLCIVGNIFALFGVLLTLIIPFLWLWKIGSLQAFWDIFSSYTPLYAQISGDLKVRGSGARIVNILYEYSNFKRLGMLATASFFGVYLVLTQSIFVAIKRPLILFFLLLICYELSAGIGGKLWSYHYIPAIYFACLGAAFVLSPFFANVSRPNFLPLLVFIVASVPIVQMAVSQQIFMKWKTPFELSKNIREDEITAYLNTHLSPNDKVQPLSWTGGTLEALLASKAIPATPYIVDLQFYHHVSTPYIQSLRKDFIARLKREPPKFIIDVYANRGISGLDTSYEFHELKMFIKVYYYKDYSGNGFDMFRRNNDQPPKKTGTGPT